MSKRKKQEYSILIKVIIFLFLLLSFIGSFYQDEIRKKLYDYLPQESYALENIPEYNGKPYVYINDNVPGFTDEEKKLTNLESYSNLDILGRAGVAFALVGVDTMPTTERTSIGMVKPSGWHTVKYDFVDGKYLYNRCHLIAFQLTGENANEKNLITCTRYMNTDGMLEFENKVAKYVKDTNNHVLYRVTPIYEGSNLLASGVQMEAYSIEDNGRGISFNIYVYNIQEGVDINYTNGESKLSEGEN